MKTKSFRLRTTLPSSSDYDVTGRRDLPSSDYGMASRTVNGGW